MKRRAFLRGASAAGGAAFASRLWRPAEASRPGRSRARSPAAGADRRGGARGGSDGAGAGPAELMLGRARLGAPRARCRHARAARGAGRREPRRGRALRHVSRQAARARRHRQPGARSRRLVARQLRDAPGRLLRRESVRVALRRLPASADRAGRHRPARPAHRHRYPEAEPAPGTFAAGDRRGRSGDAGGGGLPAGREARPHPAGRSGDLRRPDRALRRRERRSRARVDRRLDAVRARGAPRRGGAGTARATDPAQARRVDHAARAPPCLRLRGDRAAHRAAVRPAQDAHRPDGPRAHAAVFGGVRRARGAGQRALRRQAGLLRARRARQRLFDLADRLVRRLRPDAPPARRGRKAVAHARAADHRLRRRERAGPLRFLSRRLRRQDLVRRRLHGAAATCARRRLAAPRAALSSPALAPGPAQRRRARVVGASSSRCWIGRRWPRPLRVGAPSRSRRRSIPPGRPRPGAAPTRSRVCGGGIDSSGSSSTSPAAS